MAFNKIRVLLQQYLRKEVLILKTNPEKVSFNVSPTDLGYVDLLISREIYTTRTDFFHNAIKDELTNNQKQIGVLSEELHPKYDSSIELIIGTYSYSDEEILNLMRVGKTNLVVIGKLDLTRITDTKKLYEAIHTIRVFGKFNASEEIFLHYIN